MSSNPTAERARTRALRKHRRHKYLLLLLGIVLAACGYRYGLEQQQRRMAPPPRFTPIIAWTDEDTWRKAYRDDNDEFRNTEDGLPIGQVYRWDYP